MSLFFNFTSIEAQSLDFSNKKTDVKISQKSMDDKSIDDLLGPDNNFPFDPANHRDGSNPIKRIGKISDDNL
tara:strand:- start:198 stop:413 length:216 start_codon:yes stop_codon:yes gene_type:complete